MRSRVCLGQYQFWVDCHNSSLHELIQNWRFNPALLCNLHMSYCYMCSELMLNVDCTCWLPDVGGSRYDTDVEPCDEDTVPEAVSMKMQDKDQLKILSLSSTPVAVSSCPTEGMPPRAYGRYNALKWLDRALILLCVTVLIGFVLWISLPTLGELLWSTRRCNTLCSVQSSSHSLATIIKNHNRF